MLSPEASPESGQWKTSRTEYLRGVMDAFTEPTVRKVVVSKAAQVGYALALDTPVPTACGWTTMGEIRVGDRVFDEKGQLCEVTLASPVYTDHRCFRVRFSCGETIVADAGHRWFVESDRAIVGGRPWTGRGRIPADLPHAFSGVLTTDQIAAAHKYGAKQHRNTFAVPVVAAGLELPDTDLPLDPYFLGAWLGDGNAHANNLTAHESDTGFFVKEFQSAGLIATATTSGARDPHIFWISVKLPRPADACPRGHIGGVNGHGACVECVNDRARAARRGESTPRKDHPSVTGVLRALGVFGSSGSKKVPAAYLRASRAQRLALLQGLMDTDGTCGANGRAAFSGVERALVESVRELVCSLGLKPSVIREKDNNGGARVHGRAVSSDRKLLVFDFLAYADTPVFRLPRKLARQKHVGPTTRESETRRRRIVSVEPCTSVPVRCIAVSSESRLFLASKSMIPTHNTEVLNNVVGYFIDRDPATIMVVQPSVQMGETWSKKRLSPMLRDSPCLRGKVKDPKSRDSDNTILEKGYPGGYLTIVGANAPAGLASRPIRVVLADEVDRYPSSAGSEGDPLTLAMKRQTNYWDRKLLVGSTPVDKGLSIVEREYRASDMRRFHVPCPSCGHGQPLEWRGVVWDRDEDGNHLPETARYRCEDCGNLWSDIERWKAIQRGEWIARKPFAGTAGFHIPGFLSPWLTLQQIVEDFIASRPYPQKFKTFVNTIWGESWEERGERADPQKLRDRVEPYDGTCLPDAVRLVTAGVDHQDDRLEVTFVGWGDGEEAWVIEHHVLPGEVGEPTIWQRDLDTLLRKTFTTEGGRRLTVRAACVDSGGHHGNMVHAFCRRRLSRRIVATAGRGNTPVRSIPIWGNRTMRTKNSGDRLYMVGVDTGKDDLASRLRIVPKEGERLANAVHFPFTGLSADYFEQLTAEQAVTDTDRDGRAVRRWKMKPGQTRNEALDCFILAHAAALFVPVRLDLKVEATDDTADAADDPVSAPAPAPAVAAAQSLSREERRKQWVRR